ncbi:MAG: hypothetical protein ACR2G3_00495 [Solirubrobacterales bacterium]
MKLGVRWAGVLATAAAGLFAMLPASAGAGEPTTPRNGTYSGAGAEVSSPAYGVQLGFTLKGGTVTVTAAGFTLPSCSGGTSFPPVALGPNRFETTSSSSNSEVNRLTGRWVSDTKVRGKVVLERPSAASCGDPGTYVYKYTAKRYGRA